MTKEELLKFVAEQECTSKGPCPSCSGVENLPDLLAGARCPNPRCFNGIIVGDCGLCIPCRARIMLKTGKTKETELEQLRNRVKQVKEACKIAKAFQDNPLPSEFEDAKLTTATLLKRIMFILKDGETA